MERVRRDVINRKTKETNNKIEQNAKDVSCTFKPQISSKSAQLRPRSSYELSKGDLLKRESAQKLNKVRTEQEQLAAATFQPVISKYATKKQIKSKLNLTQPPGEFMEEYQRDLEKKQQTRESLLQQKNAEETKECTFKPQTTECPSYIKRIAKSMQVVRAARKLNEANKSPDQKPPSTWR